GAGNHRHVFAIACRNCSRNTGWLVAGGRIFWDGKGKRHSHGLIGRNGDLLLVKFDPLARCLVLLTRGQDVEHPSVRDNPIRSFQREGSLLGREVREFYGVFNTFTRGYVEAE